MFDLSREPKATSNKDIFKNRLWHIERVCIGFFDSPKNFLDTTKNCSR